jgi:iron complex transport system substrate-binding protein
MKSPLDGTRQIGHRRGIASAARAIMLAGALLFFCTSAADAAPPLRVVSTNLCGDEYVFRLVPRGHIAALSFEAGDRHPVVSTIADKVDGIAQIRPSAETVLRLKPDLVVMQVGALERLRLTLKTLGVAMLDLPYDNSLAEVRRTTAMLGERLGAKAQAAALLRDMDAKLAAARAAAPSPSIRTLIYQAQGYTGGGGLTKELMELAGLADVSPGYAVTRSGRVPVEEIVAAAPELMILSGERRTPTAQADLVLHHPALAALDGKTTLAWQPFLPLLCAGPWSADAAVTFARLGRTVRAGRKAGY